eukprot:763338-Hanusia_phi.AAC.6
MSLRLRDVASEFVSVSAGTRPVVMYWSQPAQAHSFCTLACALPWVPSSCMRMARPQLVESVPSVHGESDDSCSGAVCSRTACSGSKQPEK